jgi:hypothetical protein
MIQDGSLNSRLSSRWHMAHGWHTRRKRPPFACDQTPHGRATPSSGKSDSLGLEDSSALIDPLSSPQMDMAARNVPENLRVSIFRILSEAESGDSDVRYAIAPLLLAAMACSIDCFGCAKRLPVGTSWSSERARWRGRRRVNSSVAATRPSASPRATETKIQDSRCVRFREPPRSSQKRNPYGSSSAFARLSRSYPCASSSSNRSGAFRSRRATRRMSG